MGKTTWARTRRGQTAVPAPPLPAHVLATAAPSDQDLRRIELMRRAHTLLVTPGGDLHTAVMSGYLADPTVPHTFMTDTIGGPRREAPRADWATQYPHLTDLAVYSALDTAQPFNLFGSLLAAELAFALQPLYGPVFFTRRPSGDGIVAKLPLRLKDHIASTLITLQSVTSQVRPDFVTEADYALVWARLQTLLAQAHAAKNAPPHAALTG